MGLITVIDDFEHRGLHVRVVRDETDIPTRYVARVYVPKGSDGWCSSYWEAFVNGNGDAMRWHGDNAFGFVAFGLRRDVGYHFTVYFDNDDEYPVDSDAEAVKAAHLFADSCKFRIDELSKAHVAGVGR